MWPASGIDRNILLSIHGKSYRDRLLRRPGLFPEDLTGLMIVGPKAAVAIAAEYQTPAGGHRRWCMNPSRPERLKNGVRSICSRERS